MHKVTTEMRHETFPGTNIKINLIHFVSQHLTDLTAVQLNNGKIKYPAEWPLKASPRHLSQCNCVS